MMKKVAGIGLLLLLCTLWSVQAQRTTSLKINEILVINDDNFQDEYGQKSPWIEIFNASPGTVNIAGCYLTDDIRFPKKYMVPKGDVLTKISPRQHVLFWADNKPSHGTFHLNFTLNMDEANSIALFDSDGRTLIDSITVPAGQRPNVSYGLIEDGWTLKHLQEAKRTLPSYQQVTDLWVYFDDSVNDGRYITPSSNNKILDTNEKIENFKENDSWGIGMTLTAMGVVFSGLLLLYLIFKLIGYIAVSLTHQRVMKAKGISIEEAKDIAGQSGDIYAAIALAIYEATELHDEENTILTIRNTARTYSPWSSKIYTLREIPNKK
ncbi:MAG: lamin tail domain-containing protein [Dysgonamonadaceae bacterium]|jgi:Na+-transporting methylmalonyl-CoA/oxaloacetate decarboxylase gamma subunit|nr:lamin tail domain-containing protein [Dysgonamonadaceae bacterium]